MLTGMDRTSLCRQAMAAGLVLMLVSLTAATLFLSCTGPTGPMGPPGPPGSDGQDAASFVVSTVQELRDALDGMPPQGGRILMRAGTYDVSAPIVVAHDGVTIEGEGMATYVRLVDGANCPVFVLGEAIPVQPIGQHTGIVLRNMVVDGNRHGQTQELCDLPGLDHLRNNCITIRSARDCTVENVTVQSARSGGIVTEKGCSTIMLRGIIARDNHFDGIACYETVRSTISECSLDSNEAAGLSFDLDFDHNVITACFITNNDGPGIFIRASSHNHFSACHVTDNGEDGVFIADGEPPTSAGAVRNFFENNTYTFNGRHGIWQAGANSIQNVVSGGLFLGNTGNAIEQSFVVTAPLLVTGEVILP